MASLRNKGLAITVQTKTWTLVPMSVLFLLLLLSSALRAAPFTDQQQNGLLCEEVMQQDINFLTIMAGQPVLPGSASGNWTGNGDIYSVQRNVSWADPRDPCGPNGRCHANRRYSLLD